VVRSEKVFVLKDVLMSYELAAQSIRAQAGRDQPADE
jgi:hypothetical protein